MGNEITISTNDSDMRSMLIKLMGRGMTMSQTVNGQFVLTHTDVLDLINKIVQRVSLQNHTKMTDFFAEFGFEDGSAETVPTYEKLETYRSVNPTICNSCTLSFAFLIDFHTRGVEKQAVDITIQGRRPKERDRKASLFLDDNIVLGQLDVRIEYTDVTWANDIKNLFEKYCETHVQRYNIRHKIAPIFTTRSLPLLLFPFMMITMLLVEMQASTDKIAKKLGDYLKDIPSTDQLAIITRKLDVLVYRENEIRSVYGFISTIAALVGFFSCGIFDLDADQECSDLCDHCFSRITESL